MSGAAAQGPAGQQMEVKLENPSGNHVPPQSATRKKPAREVTRQHGPPVCRASRGDSAGKTLPAAQKTRVPSLGQQDALEMEMATHSSFLAWEILWTEEPGRLHSSPKSWT